VETTTFHISQHYKLVDFTAILHHHQVTQAQLSDLIPVFGIADSSTRGSSQIFKAGPSLENLTYLHSGARICLLVVSVREIQRERENKGLGAWRFFFFFEGD
jgi:hypothetical protein